jgi:thymidylate synthase (FAD)
MSNKSCVVPPHTKSYQDHHEYYEDYEKIMEIYEKWNKKDGYTKKERQEISKMFLPKASTVNMVVSGNYQAMYEFLELRTCQRAEREIQSVADTMLRYCRMRMPIIFNGCKPKCDTCKEGC